MSSLTGENNSWLEEELRCERFISGVEKTIRTSERMGRESRFMLFRNPKTEEILSSSIYVGDEYSVGMGINYGAVAKRFYEEKGLRANINQSRFEKFIKGHIKIPFPKGYSDITEGDIAMGLDPIIDFHTHPTLGMPNPSEADLLVLNGIRNKFSNDYDGINPLMIISGKRERGINSLLLLQENSDYPVDCEELKEQVSKMYSPEEEQKRNLLNAIFSGYFFPELLQKNYNLSTGNLNRKDHTLDSGIGIRHFSPIDRIDYDPVNLD